MNSSTAFSISTDNAIVLTSEASDGEHLQATFLPDRGMNLISYKKGDIEVIDQSTWNLFEERFAGLGALIGPHFHRRHTEVLPVIADESLFPHIERVKAKGVADPFSHGIARYAPWKAEATENTLKASLSGKDTWNGVPLSTLEGQGFKMNLQASLTSKGLQLMLDVVSDTDSLVGIHYYYHLPKGTGSVISGVRREYLNSAGLQMIPETWSLDSEQVMTFDLANEADYTFYPYPHMREGKILLDAGAYRLKTTYQCQSQENAWQLYHPQGASYVCIEPLSSQDPRHPNLTVSALDITLEIE